MQKEPLSAPSLIIFDDEEDILLICASVLKSLGWSVATYTDVNDVVSRVSDIMPAVIIMDHHVPKDGGIKASQRIKQNDLLKYIPIIFISANLQIETLAAAAGADYWMSKPFTPEQLEAAVERATAR